MGKQRTIKQSVYLSEEEYKSAVDEAEKLGHTLSGYLRFLVRSNSPKLKKK